MPNKTSIIPRSILIIFFYTYWSLFSYDKNETRRTIIMNTKKEIHVSPWHSSISCFAFASQRVGSQSYTYALRVPGSPVVLFRSFICEIHLYMYTNVYRHAETWTEMLCRFLKDRCRYVGKILRHCYASRLLGYLMFGISFK